MPLAKSIYAALTYDQWKQVATLTEIMFKCCKKCGSILYSDGSCLQCEIGK